MLVRHVKFLEQFLTAIQNCLHIIFFFASCDKKGLNEASYAAYIKRKVSVKIEAIKKTTTLLMGSNKASVVLN